MNTEGAALQGSGWVVNYLFISFFRCLLELQCFFIFPAALNMFEETLANVLCLLRIVLVVACS